MRIPSLDELVEVEDFRKTVRELRTSIEGRAQLAESGRDPWFSANHPTASMNREFIAWDMEGITYVEGEPQSPVLFGASTGDTIRSTDLSTIEMLQCILHVERQHPDAYHVGYSFNYDINQILCDLPETALRELKEKQNVRWNGYRLQWIPSKWFRVSVGRGSEKTVAQIWDVFTFFGTSFVNACRKMLGCGKAHESDQICSSSICRELDVIERDKKLRGSFRYEDLESLVIPYWKSELRFLVDLANALRENLYDAGYRISKWYGPGSATSFVLQRERIAEHMAVPQYIVDRRARIVDGDGPVSRDNGSSVVQQRRSGMGRNRAHGIVPDPVNNAAQFAYAGGRFELFKCGRYLGKVWQYDINSAYPWAIAQLPSLAHGEWVPVSEYDPEREFAVYRVRCELPYRANIPYPFYFRDKRHCIYFPPIVEGWYWAPEIRHMAGLPGFHIYEGFVFHERNHVRPFAWVNDAFRQRLEWKRQGNPSEYSVKIMLNAMYGKMAQRVGYNKEHLLPPKWHQLEWAGWVTSKARSVLYDAMLQAAGNLLAVETDAVFSLQPLRLPTGEQLGEWGVDEYDEIIYVQSGFRFYRSGDEWFHKYRGLDPESVSLDIVRETLQRTDFRDPAYIWGTTNRFVSLPTGLLRGIETKWRSWETATRKVLIGSDGKRVHIRELCQACQKGATAWEALHTLAPGIPKDSEQTPHGIPWKSPLDRYQVMWNEMIDSA